MIFIVNTANAHCEDKKPAKVGIMTGTGVLYLFLESFKPGKSECNVTLILFQEARESSLGSH